jgi:hypothetical protein
VSIDYAEVYRLAKKGREAEQRGAAFKGCLTALLQKAFADAVAAWMFMLAVGVAHAEWIRELPTLGFWWALLMVVLVRPLFGGYAKATKNNK